MPYPPGPSFMLTTTLRDEAAALVSEAARAEREALWALGPILAAAERTRGPPSGLELRPLNAATLPDLFACVDEIPISGLREEAALCRARLEPLLGQGSGAQAQGPDSKPAPKFDGRLLYQMPSQGQGQGPGPAPRRAYPVGAARAGRLWAARRGRALVSLLSLDRADAARPGRGTAALRGVWSRRRARPVSMASSLWRRRSMSSCITRAIERGGFIEVARQGDTRLLELRLTEAPSRAQFVEPPPAPAGGPLPVVVRHNYHCPLLVRVRREVVQLGRQLGAAVRVDEADAAPGETAGVTVGGKLLPHGPIGREPLRRGLEEAISHWRR